MRFFRWPEFLGLGYLVALALPLLTLVLFAAGGGVRAADYGRLLGNTVGLALAVAVTAFLLALPLALARVARDLPFARGLDLLGILPLAIPGYVVAFAWLAAGGPGGLFAQRFGLALPQPSGFLGAWWVLSLYTFPYFYLGLRGALERIDAGVIEAARTLGAGRGELFFRVLLPLLWPGVALSALVVFLHAIADFGVVALVRYPTFSYAIYLAFETAFDRAGAAWLALVLLALVALLLALEARLSRGATSAPAARPFRLRLGSARAGFALYFFFLAALALGVPLFSILSWAGVGVFRLEAGELLAALGGSLKAALPTALLGTVLALALALAERWGRPLFARAAFFGYAVPPMALALSLVVLALSGLPFLYQTPVPLVWAYLAHYAAEALGPVRAALAPLSPRLEEAAAVLGEGPWGRFRRAIWPQVRGGTLAGGLLLFLAVVKDLPLTLILAPLGLETLAVALWGYIQEGLFAQAAPFALVLLVLGAVSGTILARLWRTG